VIEISGTTRVFPVIGWPVEQVRAPLVFNAYFQKYAIDAVCVPMRVHPDNYASFVKSVMSATNVGGIFVSIPFKPASVDVAEIATRAATIAGAANAIYKDSDGRIVADLIDGEGFVRALDRTCAEGGSAKFDYAGSCALVVGCGGVGCAIAAALAERGLRRIRLIDVDNQLTARLVYRLQKFFPQIDVAAHDLVMSQYDLLVNCTPLGMYADDDMPFSLVDLKQSAIVADCGMKIEMTELLRKATDCGLRIQKGKEMFFEQSPLYMDRFGLGSTSADQFRSLGVL
jgi:shikimate dehydrogenase